MKNQKEVNATGGGPNRLYTFSALEETVIELTSISKQVSGIKHSRAFGLPATSTSTIGPSTDTIAQLADDCFEAENTEVDNNIEDGADESITDCILVPVSTKKRENKREIQNPTNTLLSQQIKIQEELKNEFCNFFSSYKDSANTTESSFKKIYRALDKIADYQKESLQEQRRHNAVVAKLARDKLELKQKILELELQRNSALMSPRE